MGTARWFRVAEGPSEGELRLSGWMTGAVPNGSGGWVQYGSCPRCGALVLDAFGYQRGHERWHAATDLPVPEELR